MTETTTADVTAAQREMYALEEQLFGMPRGAERTALEAAYDAARAHAIAVTAQALADGVDITAAQPSLAERVRTAYATLTNRQTGQWVSLRRLRDELGQPDKAEMDDALLALAREADVAIVPENNQKSLTDADRAAALWMGGQWKHLIAIGY
jgi:hypothetical protein